MVSWWVIDLYFNNEQIQTRDVVIMNSEYGSSGSFGSIVGSKYILHNTYTDIISSVCSKPTPINISVNKYELKF